MESNAISSISKRKRHHASTDASVTKHKSVTIDALPKALVSVKDIVEDQLLLLSRKQIKPVYIMKYSILFNFFSGFR